MNFLHKMKENINLIFILYRKRRRLPVSGVAFDKNRLFFPN